MYSGIVLCNGRSVCSDRLVYCRKIFGCFIKYMHELFRRLLFNQHRTVKLHELLGRYVSCVHRNISRC